MADTRNGLNSSTLPPSLNVALLPFSNSSAYSDIKFKVGSSGQIFYGHKVILSARSPVFAAMFKSSLMIPEDGVVIPDVEPMVFQIFLDLIYGDINKPVRFMTTKSQSSSPPSKSRYFISVEEAIGVLYIAEKYLVSSMSSKWIMANMKPEQSLAFFGELTSLIELGAMDVLAQTEALMDNECAKILASSEFLELNQEDLSNYLKRDGLVIQEIALFKAVIRWATAHCESKNLPATSENLRTALEPIIHFIRFPTMTRVEFTEEVIPTEILTMEQALEVHKCYENERLISTAVSPFTPIVTVNSQQSGPQGSTATNQSQTPDVPQTFSTVCRRIPVPPASDDDDDDDETWNLLIMDRARSEANWARLRAFIQEEPARIEAARIEGARIEAARIEAARIEAARIEAARIQQQPACIIC